MRLSWKRATHGDPSPPRTPRRFGVPGRPPGADPLGRCPAAAVAHGPDRPVPPKRSSSGTPPRRCPRGLVRADKRPPRRARHVLCQCVRLFRWPPRRWTPSPAGSTSRSPVRSPAPAARSSLRLGGREKQVLIAFVEAAQGGCRGSRRFSHRTNVTAADLSQRSHRGGRRVPERVWKVPDEQAPTGARHE